ncbi:hypothetical protein SAMN02745165_02386 [Malonomonas rubra DSM 5091]|uniref:GAF domain-containing protein n=1 Tax=Malonomonas rubra DSM 5091 TaxID=1122189 RepID=A0A1M6JC39_MALRU|nr:hypothetical protein [Malonomonas rubra]SHJ44182.1 hypothetical protein SAMN02745165_02386 [Malonomonas rubra DSM 5091]
MPSQEVKSLLPALQKMKLLLWQLDLAKRTFTNLNSCPELILSAEDYRFFKDKDYRFRQLHPDDRGDLEQAIKCFKERQPVQLVFRVQNEDKIHWFRMSGWPAEDFRLYEGSVEEITGQIHQLKNIFEDQNRMLLEDAVPYPVALFLWPCLTLQKANLAFVDRLDLNAAKNRKTQLKDLLIGDINLPLLLESLMSERHLTTELTLTTGLQPTHKVLCRLEYFSHAGQAYLRLAMLDDNSISKPAEQNPQTTTQDISQLCSSLADCWSIEAMLARIYQSRELFPGLDAVMYSDIYARKDRVVVYSHGELKEPLTPGSRFPYTGTIAENIAKENLEYLIVDNTQSSIKAIDWMLFVPKGLYSYIAKACYERGAMRTVLIFCSQQKNSFSERQVEAITAIAEAFHKQLKKIRRREKTE